MKSKLIVLGVLLGTAGAATADPDAPPFTSYVAFGDSLTDDGKFGTLAPPSFEGRFTSGPTFAEYIAGAFTSAGLDSNNLALGGATATRIDDDGDATTPPPPPAIPLGDFQGQLEVFLSAQSAGTPIPTNLNPLELDVTPPQPGTNPLASVLFGANDIFTLLGAGTTIGSVATADVEAIADTVTANIASLTHLTGGLYNDFLVIDLPDLGMVPAYRGTAKEALATQVSGVYNDRLNGNLDLLSSSLSPVGPLNILRFSLAGFLADVRSGKTVLPGVTDFDTPCTPTVAVFTPLDNCALVDPALVTERLFVDRVHPNGQAHAAVARTILAGISDQLPTPVPLPAGLPLLLAGLGALAVVARRDRITWR